MLTTCVPPPRSQGLGHKPQKWTLAELRSVSAGFLIGTDRKPGSEEGRSCRRTWVKKLAWEWLTGFAAGTPPPASTSASTGLAAMSPCLPPRNLCMTVCRNCPVSPGASVWAPALLTESGWWGVCLLVSVQGNRQYWEHYSQWEQHWVLGSFCPPKKANVHCCIIKTCWKMVLILKQGHIFAFQMALKLQLQPWWKSC